MEASATTSSTTTSTTTVAPDQNSPIKELTGIQKAAILIITMGPQNSVPVIQGLGEKEVELLTLEMARNSKITPEQRELVLDEFHQMCMANTYIESGGVDYARDVIEKALGQQKAFEIMNRLSTSLKMRPFDVIRRADPKQLFSFIQNEHPQTIALVMTYLPPEKSSILLASLPPNIRVNVSKRIALMGRINPDILKEIEAVLERKLSNLAPVDYASTSGIQSLVDTLNRTDASTLKGIMDALEVDDPDLAEQIKRQMFIFDDIVLLDDKAVQLVLREVDNKDLAKALKGANEDVKNKILTNMSTRASQVLNEDIKFIGSLRVRDVEDAQQKVIKIIRKLEEAGTIVISRGADEIVI